MDSPQLVRRLWDHLQWADAALLRALRSADATAPGPVVREYAHILGAEEVWLARIQSRPTRLAVWPDVPQEELEQLSMRIADGYAQLFHNLDDAGLSRMISYSNSAGQSFTNTLADILLHVALHGQYHRGKVNLMLRQAGLSPEPVDCIAYFRGAPAARSR